MNSATFVSILGVCAIFLAVCGFVALAVIPTKKAEPKLHKKAKSADGELYVKVGGKFYKVQDVEPEKKPQEKKYKPWVTW